MGARLVEDAVVLDVVAAVLVDRRVEPGAAVALAAELEGADQAPVALRVVREHFEFALGRASCARLDELIELYGVRPPNEAIHVDRLSGGNQQKVMLARAFAQPPITVAALAYPTQGLDVQAAANVHQLLIASR